MQYSLREITNISEEPSEHIPDDIFFTGAAVRTSNLTCSKQFAGSLSSLVVQWDTTGL